MQVQLADLRLAMKQAHCQAKVSCNFTRVRVGTVYTEIDASRKMINNPMKCVKRNLTEQSCHQLKAFSAMQNTYIHYNYCTHKNFRCAV